MWSKIKNWLVSQAAQFICAFTLSKIAEYLLEEYKPINLNFMNPFYWYCLTIILFFGFAFLFKKLFNNNKIDTNQVFEKSQNNYLPPLSYLNFKVTIKEIKGDKRFKIDLISKQNIDSKIATIVDISGNLIILLRLKFEYPITDKPNYSIQKTTQSSDECEIYHDENLQNVLYNVGIGGFVSMAILPIRIFIENGGEYKLEFKTS